MTRNSFKSNIGFTLIELIMVVVIAGILVALALPQYSGLMEKSRTAEAISAIDSIRVAEQSERIFSGNYITYADAPAIAAGLGVTLRVTNWGYKTDATAGTSVVITATRTAANNGTVGQTIILTWTNATQTGVWTGSHPNKPQN